MDWAMSLYDGKYLTSHKRHDNVGIREADLNQGGACDRNVKQTAANGPFSQGAPRGSAGPR